ncbi:MAG: general secretion pathway protein GspK [Sphingomonadales bacterium]
MERTGERGLALISVLWLMLLLSLMLGAVLTTARVGVKMSGAAAQHVEAATIAEAGVNRAILGLLNDNRSQRWQPDGRPHNFQFAGRTVKISVTDEAGKFDLNAAADELLDRLFQSAGLSPEDSARLVDAIGDWRDPDDLRRLNGAEAGTYRSAGLDYGPRNGPFEVVSELRQVLGMTDELYRCVEPALTLHSGRRTADSRVAPAPVKKALGLREDHTTGAPTASGGPGVVAMAGSLGGRAFTIRAEVAIPDSAPLLREATIRITENPREPYWILSWGGGRSNQSHATELCEKQLNRLAMN